MSTQDIYLGNPNLKRANVAQNFSPEEVEEFVKCSKDPVYFMKKYFLLLELLKLGKIILFFFEKMLCDQKHKKYVEQIY